MILETYLDERGRDLFSLSVNALPIRAQTRIRTALGKFEDGNLGDHKPLQDGVYEHRIHAEGGLRIYFAKIGTKVILLLAAGSKSNQSRDVKAAIQRLKTYHE